jgi:hypothetical protein
VDFKLSSSDAVAILLAVVQMLVATVLAVWTVQKTVPLQRVDPTPQPRQSTKRLLMLWVRSCWLFMLGLAFGLLALWSIAQSEEPLSRAFVFRLVGWSVYTSLNLAAAICFLFLELQDYINERVLHLLESSHLNEQRVLRVLQNSNLVERGLLDAVSSRSQSTQRSGANRAVSRKRRK